MASPSIPKRSNDGGNNLWGIYIHIGGSGKVQKDRAGALYGLRGKFGNATEQAVERFRAVWPGRNINDLMAEDAMCRLAAIQYIQEKARVSSAPYTPICLRMRALLEAVFRLGIAWKSPLCSAILIMWLVAWKGRSPKSWRVKFPRLGSALRKWISTA